MSQAPNSPDITENDKLMAALSDPIPIVAIIILLVEDMKNRPFQKFHAIQAIAANILVWIVIAVLGTILGSSPSASAAGCPVSSGSSPSTGPSRLTRVSTSRSPGSPSS